jgi:FAD synthase
MNLFSVEGIVQKGAGKGAQLGFPTANIPCAGEVPSGIYAGEVMRKEKSYPAAIYKEDGKNIIEAHLLDFSGNLYGETIQVVAHKKIRDTKKFASEQELVAAIQKDIDVISVIMKP